ncbi:M28 family metallopeptidase [Sphingomonas flavescens]|uniref:M28 family metallopeptidase n=1 Tax=Sphingomonas flavescens TaxID=3132797 RepID=UPI0028063786|nr:M28 family peptidase [Sphingomonas limnosediminicola]
MKTIFAALCATAALATTPALAQSTITERSVAAHEAFLASDALQGRGSATRDEAIAAVYVASQFQAYGLVPAPGMDGYLQKAVVVRETLTAPATLTVGGAAIASPTLLLSSGKPISGTLAVAAVADPAKLPTADIVLVSAKDADPMTIYRAIAGKPVKLLIVRENEGSRKLLGMLGGKPRLPVYLEEKPPRERPSLITLPDAAVDALASRVGAPVMLNIATTKERATTTNAIGYLKGRDAKAGTLLLTAHLDHLGLRPDGTIMPGANDDASGTTAVMELARALATGKQPRRSILFVCYGSEEIGGYGSTYFGEHPPVRLDQIAANIEFEMIGSQDPKLPKNTLMMTGFDRSNLGPALKAHGALVTSDPYPEQNFFQRSDNYSLALKGVVAHTVSGWAVVPTYHQPTDTAANLNIPFMTSAIRSLVAPMRWLADSSFTPAWTANGRPTQER